MIKQFITAISVLALITACGTPHENKPADVEDVEAASAETTSTAEVPTPDIDLWSILAGAYEVVAVRRASETAAPADLEPGVDLRGEKITIGEGVVSIAGAACDSWGLSKEGGPDVMDADPMLDDLRLPLLDSETPQHGSVYNLSCKGELEFVIYQADPRAIAIPWDNGATYLIAEKTLSPEQIKKFQAQLKDMKFQSGAVSDSWTESGLIGLRSYYSYRARSDDAFVFQRPAITASLLEKLGVIEN